MPVGPLVGLPRKFVPQDFTIMTTPGLRELANICAIQFKNSRRATKTKLKMIKRAIVMKDFDCLLNLGFIL